MQKLQGELAEMKSKLDELTQQLQSEKLRSKRLEEDLHIQATQHIKQVSKVQTEKESLQDELREERNKWVQESLKLKSEIRMAQENVQTQTRSLEERHAKHVNELAERHTQEVEKIRQEVIAQYDLQLRH